MSVSATEFLKKLPAEVLKRAEKLKVRECDEEEKGRFVAFVADGKQDFDVSISFSSDKKIIEHQCDCEDSNPICLHKTALILFLENKSEQQAKKEKQVKKRNLSPSGELVFSLPEAEIRNWLVSQLAKRKDLEFIFLQDFGEKKQEFNAAEVEEVTKNAIAAILKNKNKRKLEQSEIPKILANMKRVHEPFLQHFLEQPDNLERSKILLELIISVVRFDFSIKNQSKKIINYCESLYHQAEKGINGLVSEEAWLRSVNHLKMGLEHQSQIIPNIYKELFEILYTNARPERKKLLEPIVRKFMVI